MRHLTLALVLLAVAAPPVAASDAGASTPATPTAGAPVAPAPPDAATAPEPAPTVPPTPTNAERLAAVEQARANLVEQCQRGIAEHNGAIAVLRDMVGGTVTAPAAP